jgi:diadenosine tetraphosphate (Ap4A) HIT family hydrolase
VPHVHVHIIPRKDGDFEKNDEIYDAVSYRIRIPYTVCACYLIFMLHASIGV